MKCFLVLVGSVNHPSCDYLLHFLGVGDVDPADGEHLLLVCYIDELGSSISTYYGRVEGLQEFSGDLAFFAVLANEEDSSTLVVEGAWSCRVR